MNIYIGKNKFQFITDFSKHAAYDTNGNQIIIDFNTLTIYERIMLSSYLTILCDYRSEDKKMENIYNKIFNFNSEKKYVKTSYHDEFINDLSNYLKKSPEFFHFIKDNFDRIDNEKTFIFRQQLNASEMDLLYSLKFQRSYRSLMNVLYIIGVSKQNIKTEALNKIPLNVFYSNSTLAKRRVEDIFNKINSVSKNKIKYKIYNNIVYFGNGFEIEEDEEFYSDKKKEVLNQLREKEILDELECDRKETHAVKQTSIIKQEAKEEIEEIPEIIEKTLNENVDVFNLGDHRLNKEMIVDYINENSYKIDNFDFQKYTELFRKYENSKTYKNYITKLLGNGSKDIPVVYKKKDIYFDGDDGLERKNNAIYQIKEIQEAVIKSLNKVYDYDEDHSRYIALLNFVCKNYSPLFTNF